MPTPTPLPVSGAVNTFMQSGSQSAMQVAIGVYSSKTIAYASSITPAVDPVPVTVINIDTLSGDITINNPSGTPSDGQIIKERISQDNPGGHAITRGNLWAYTTTVPNSGDSAEPTAANAKWENVWEWSAGDSLWYRVGFNQR